MAKQNISPQNGHLSFITEASTSNKQIKVAPLRKEGAWGEVQPRAKAYRGSRSHLLICSLTHLLIFLLPFLASASGVSISGLQVVPGKALQYKICWDHAWNLEGKAAPGNHDAVWVFAKYRLPGGVWQTLPLRKGPDTVSTGTYEMIYVADGAGVFVRRTVAEPCTGAEAPLSMDYDFTRLTEPGQYEFRVFAVEMVWVPEAPFYVGDGQGIFTFRRGDVNKPFRIKSEAAIALGKDSLTLNDTGKFKPAGTIPAAWPKGYAGFYCMKYEISQEQYTDFLNTLTYRQQKNRTATAPGSNAGTAAMNFSLANRTGIIIATPGQAENTPAVYACNAKADQAFNATDDGQNRACNFLSWADMAAYLDWAGLRPMTEMEFEKVCRGPEMSVARQMAWGGKLVTDANTLTEDGTATEHSTDVLNAGYGLASHGYAGPQGPLRNGFAAGVTTDRTQSGAAYYGAMEMSGNLWEQCVTVDAPGLLFTGALGNGKLDANGNADVQGWPAANGDGTGTRGGAWNSGVLAEFCDLAISDRFYAGQSVNFRRNTSGGRGVR